MEHNRTALGLDVGAVFVKLVVLDGQGNVASTSSRRHRGNPLEAAREEVERVAADKPVAIGLTGVNAPLVADGLALAPVDLVQAEIAAVRAKFPEVRNIINVGGGSVTLVQLDEKGRFLDCSANSLCAAGTGSFLDQQAKRLGIDYADLDGFARVDDPPPIATRCSVFAKTDLIHRQQEGYGKAALWCGLCRSMTGTFLNTLLRGRPLQGLTVLTGGVSQNSEVLRWLRERYGDMVQTYELATYSCAEGAARLTDGRVDDLAGILAAMRSNGPQAEDDFRRPALAFRKTRYPDFAVAESSVDGQGNEIRVTAWPAAGTVRAYLGVDVGSTSTKLMLIDEQGEALADVYRRTAGDPIGATKLLFAAVAELAAKKGTGVEVLGAAVTGSGRKLVGAVVGADVVVNEITAHLEGALRVDPGIETIFEIGGQDSKYIRARGGRIVDSNMNYVCAAGTGSFVEEVAAKLGLALDEIGDVAMGIAPPATSDRCTVFMEQDVDRLVRRGYSREECIAAVLCSVVKNYLTKVVGRRPVSRDKVFFQGATARNKGLAAAFENVLGVEVVVSPYCHVMGAYGAALLAKRRAESGDGATRFKGLDLSKRSIALRNETCELCQNHCKITFADIEGEAEAPSWGYMCGRDPDSAAVRRNVEYAPFQKRLAMSGFSAPPPKGEPRATVGIPRALATYSMLPLWRAFFDELNCRIQLSKPTDNDTVQRGAELTAADFCFPVKLAHAAAEELLRDGAADWAFLPHMIQAPPNPAAVNSHFCPYVQAFPSVIESAMRARDVDEGRIASPVVDMIRPESEAVRNLHKALGERLGVSRADVARAWRKGCAALDAFAEKRREEGRRLISEIEASGERAIVVIGRPYTVLDMGANLSLPQKMAQFGMRVIPMDLLPYDVRGLNPDLNRMYWQYGQEILCAAEYVRDHPNLFAVFLTNFSCGPDSFLLTLVEEVMGEKPHLAIELDEHGGDAGYLTRIEAFLDVVASSEVKPQPKFRIPSPASDAAAFEGRELWISPMHPVIPRLFAAAFQGEGHDAVAAPPETGATFDLGRQHTRGSECLPAALTTGSFLEHVGEGGGRHALFMPCAEGPCRFGQYSVLQRLVMNRLGMGDVPIMSPSDSNTYQGLSQRLRLRLWDAILAGDAIYKCLCRLRPYEREPGAAEAATEEATALVEHSMADGGEVLPALHEAVRLMLAVPVREGERKPLVGIVGEIYVRCNEFSNDYLVSAIERAGGEAWLAPASEWILYTAAMEGFEARRRPWRLLRRATTHLKNSFLFRQEHRFAEAAAPVLADRREPPIEEVLAEGAKMLPQEFAGEAIATVGRAAVFARQGAAMVANAAPFGCMPGTITAALCRELQTRIGIPIVSLFYDGEKDVNQRLGVFLSNLRARDGDGSK